jgi:hypothetical protein
MKPKLSLSEREEIIKFFKDNLNMDVSKFSDDELEEELEDLNKVLDQKLREEETKYLNLKKELINKRNEYESLLNQMNDIITS